ncbi:MAG TPA: O-methyltransferase, partial [Pirellulales bacterium]|nr:O-methyltransferase [Pirellulales bacterium]
MSQEQWTEIEHYITESVVRPDAALEAALAASEQAGLPAINVSPNLGKLLGLLARAQQARNILEVGTLGGYSTIWMARALPPGGRLITLEIDAKHAEVAAANFARAGVEHLIELRLAPALETLPRLAAEGRGPFDLIFIDADKPSNPEYFSWALRLSRPGTMIIVDNVVRGGAVANAASADASVQGVRR